MKPPGEVLRSSGYVVDSIPLGMGRQLAQAHHYSQSSSSAAVYRHGLFPADNPLDCVGFAQWLNAIRSSGELVAGPRWREVLVLTRLVVEPGQPTNAASFLLGRSIRLIRQEGRFSVLLTFADEGQGHTGAIYRATNWEEAGTTDPNVLWTDGEGRHRSKRKRDGNMRLASDMRALGWTSTTTRKRRFVIYLDQSARPARMGAPA